jgi:hypothetical protein
VGVWEPLSTSVSSQSFGVRKRFVKFGSGVGLSSTCAKPRHNVAVYCRSITVFADGVAAGHKVGQPTVAGTREEALAVVCCLSLISWLLGKL